MKIITTILIYFLGLGYTGSSVESNLSFRQTASSGKFSTDVNNKKNAQADTCENAVYPTVSINPPAFVDETMIEYTIEQDAQVRLFVVNENDTAIACLVDRFQEKGSYQISFDASRLTPGYYYALFMADDLVVFESMDKLEDVKSETERQR